MSPFLKKLFGRGTTGAVARALEPITTVAGVTDYAFLDGRGALVTRTSNFGYEDERLQQCTETLRRSNALLNEYLGPEAADGEPLTFHFRNGWLLVWRMGAGALVVLGQEGLDLPMLRMRLNILRSQITGDKRFRDYLTGAPDAGPGQLRETAGSETERCWIDTICGAGT